MYSRSIFRKCRTSLCFSVDSLVYISSLHFTVANDTFGKFRVRDGKNSEHRGCCFVKDPEIANSIASCVAKEWNGGYLLEANPGPGVLSSYLVQNGVKHLRLFEKNKEFFPALEVLSSEYPSIEIVHEDLMMIPQYEHKRKFDPSVQQSLVQEYFNNIFKNVPCCSWEKDPPFQILSVIANKKSLKFLRYLLAALPNQGTLFSFGRCEFFLLVSEKEFMCMNALPKDNYAMYRWSTVLYNLFYEIKCLQKFLVDSENFFFFNTVQNQKRLANTYFYLIKLTPKRDIFSHPTTPEKLQEFLFFVRSNLTKRTDPVIQTIEKWAHFCGPRLIKEGWNVFVRFGDLSPAEIWKLFNCLASWSEYRGCYSKALACKFNRKKLLEDDVCNE